MRIWAVSAAYTLAFIAALVTIWASMALGVGSFFQGRSNIVSLTILLPVLGGLCVFSLVYGLASGRIFMWRFWVAVPLVLAMLIIGSFQLVWHGYVTVFEALIIDVLLAFGAGFFACLKRDAVTNSETDNVE